MLALAGRKPPAAKQSERDTQYTDIRSTGVRVAGGEAVAAAVVVKTPVEPRVGGAAFATIG